ncbi:MAG: hypothetical protein GDA49_02255 [Rhodospirillales bacterium]|nr:hypothetical protein [Rhodospirillales bacterium]
MVEEHGAAPPTLALNTKLEDDFVSPLTAVRGSLEILRDHPELAVADRRRFIDMALDGCARLDHGINDLAASVYAAGQRADDEPADGLAAGEPAQRIRFDHETNIAELDLSDLEFDSSTAVNAFYDRISAALEATGKKWFLMVDHTDCNIWPEAWIAFAYRSKKAAAAYALGVARYAMCPSGNQPAASGMFSSREDAMADIERQRGR